MRVGSLFSGIGGIELGLDQAGGFETAWFVENEPYAQAILRKRFPNATIYDDVTTLDFGSVPKIDVLTGGFPCQDISVAGKRAGITGSRSSLWKYYCEAISILRPRFAIIENVAALTQRGLDVVLCDLAEVGYDAEWHCISASSVGAPHRRDRIFVIAYPTRSQAKPECEESGGLSEQRWHSLGYWQETLRQENGKASDNEPCRCGVEMANSNQKRMRQLQPLQGVSPSWSSEPDVGRVADGVPSRVDRIKCLGNAVVPAVAEAIGKAIKEREGW